MGVGDVDACRRGYSYSAGQSRTVLYKCTVLYCKVLYCTVSHGTKWGIQSRELGAFFSFLQAREGTSREVEGVRCAPVLERGREAARAAASSDSYPPAASEQAPGTMTLCCHLPLREESCTSAGEDHHPCSVGPKKLIKLLNACTTGCLGTHQGTLGGCQEAAGGRSVGR